MDGRNSSTLELWELGGLNRLSGMQEYISLTRFINLGSASGMHALHQRAHTRAAVAAILLLFV